jgi:hypothetical protein
MFAGCITQQGSFYDEMRSQPVQIKAGDLFEPCENAGCYALKCTFTNSLWNTNVSAFDNYSSLLGGYCGVGACDGNCLATLFAPLAAGEDQDYVLKVFYENVGIGNAFERLNPLVNNSLRAVTLVAWANNSTYILPPPHLLACYLDKGVLPVVVFWDYNYSAGRFFKHKDEIESAAQLYNKIGPVGLVSDPWLLSVRNDPTLLHLSNLRYNVLNNCPNCLFSFGFFFNNSEDDYALVRGRARKVLFVDSDPYNTQPSLTFFPKLISPIALNLSFAQCSYSKLYFFFLQFANYALRLQKEDGEVVKGGVLTALPLLNPLAPDCENVEQEGLADFVINLPFLPQLGVVFSSIIYPHQFTAPFAQSLSSDTEQAVLGFLYAYYSLSHKISEDVVEMPALAPLVFTSGCNHTCTFESTNFNLLRYENVSAGPTRPFSNFLPRSHPPLFSCLYTYSPSLNVSVNEPASCELTAHDINTGEAFYVSPMLLKAARVAASHGQTQFVEFAPTDSDCNPLNLNVHEIFPQLSVDVQAQKHACEQKYGKACKVCRWGPFALSLYPSHVYEEKGLRAPEVTRVCDLDGNGFDPLNMNESECAFAYLLNKALIEEERDGWNDTNLVLFKALNDVWKQQYPCKYGGKCDFDDWMRMFEHQHNVPPHSLYATPYEFVKFVLHDGEHSYAADTLFVFHHLKRHCSYDVYDPKFLSQSYQFKPYKQYNS